MAALSFVFWKPDLDTALAALLAGFGAGSHVRCSIGPAAPSELASETVACIECGGSGQVHLNNFDHHGDGPWLPPACVQAAARFGIVGDHIRRLVDYVAARDQGLPGRAHPGAIPLSMAHSGMRMLVREPVDQLRHGVAMLGSVAASRIDPEDIRPLLGLFPRWREYLKAFLSARGELQALVPQVRRFTTRGGRAAMFLRASRPGVHGMLKRLGADISLAAGLGGVRMYSVSAVSSTAGVLSPLLRRLDLCEPGWGGPAEGGIIASPPGGSSLDQESLCAIVADCL